MRAPDFGNAGPGLLYNDPFSERAFPARTQTIGWSVGRNGGLGEALNARIRSKYSSHYGIRIDPTRVMNFPFITGTKGLGEKGTLLVGPTWHPYYEAVASYWCHLGRKESSDFSFGGSASRHDMAASATTRP